MKITDISGKILDTLPLDTKLLVYDEELEKYVREIINNIRKYGDREIIRLCEKFDEAPVGFNIKTSESEFEEAEKILSEDQGLRGILDSFYKMADRVKTFHEKQKEFFHLCGRFEVEIDKNSFLGQIIKPLDNVVVYVPGGRAIYPSTLIMNVIPAIVAGVSNIYISTPSFRGKISPIILHLARKLGISEVYKVGGAASVASFAFGTESIPKADLIVGPGNKYFVIAKRLLFGIIGIDMLPGPSEIAIFSNDGNPLYLALDVLSQLEHDPESSGYFVSQNETFLESVRKTLEDLKTTSRKEVLEKSLNNLFFILVSSIEEGFDVINAVAPEHLEINVKGINKDNVDKYIKHAGTVLIGENSPVVITDYISGINHVLPTSRTARFSSPLGVYNFVKFYNFASWSEKLLKEDIVHIVKIAEYENLQMHAKSAKVRA